VVVGKVVGKVVGRVVDRAVDIVVEASEQHYIHNSGTQGL
jgi:hypothetical protein